MVGCGYVQKSDHLYSSLMLLFFYKVHTNTDSVIKLAKFFTGHTHSVIKYAVSVVTPCFIEQRDHHA